MTCGTAARTGRPGTGAAPHSALGLACSGSCAQAFNHALAPSALPRGVTPADLAGGFGLPGVTGLPGRIEDSFRRRLEVLPAATQRLMLVAAAEPAGEPALVWRAGGTGRGGARGPPPPPGGP